jgi:hypothetical protein
LAEPSHDPLRVWESFEEACRASGASGHPSRYAASYFYRDREAAVVAFSDRCLRPTDCARSYEHRLLASRARLSEQALHNARLETFRTLVTPPNG